jgi:hypothetical protein
MGWLVLAVGPIALAAIILWARDRYRDAHNISEATRKLVDGKNVEIAKGFIFGFYFLGCAYQAIETTAFRQRILFAGTSIVCLWLCLIRYQNYRRIRIDLKKRVGPNLPDVSD